MNTVSLYKINEFDKMDPFLITLVSSSDYWMYISSTGCLSAGRRNAETCLFPYVTDDLLHSNKRITGPSTIIKAQDNKEQELIWEPFSIGASNYKLKRNLYKNATGTKVIFEEVNLSLQLTFKYKWSVSKGFGFVRSCSIINNSNELSKIRVVDGLKNIMPAGVELSTQQTMSNLSNAYRQSEIISPLNYAIFSLTSLLMDRPEPGESLRANVAWCISKNKYKSSLDSDQINNFRESSRFEESHQLNGKSGSYFIHIDDYIKEQESIDWDIICDVNLNQVEISKMILNIEQNNSLLNKINDGFKFENNKLDQFIASADGFQSTNNPVNDMHHTANVLFNIMRGGILYDNYKVEKYNFMSYMQLRNKNIFKKYKNELDALKESSTTFDLIDLALKINDVSLIRLCYSYIPLTFGRRHGDPSRPWNFFDIKVEDEYKNKILYYEGNWRDIFQNWEALSISYPKTLESMLSNFVNNCTADGYNPYRITSDGIDWETIDPDNTWSYIGYWNDHQIIYLLKFLESLSSLDSNIINKFLHKEIFSYANVPYEIKSFSELVKNPKQTIKFDFSKHDKIVDLIEIIGTDAKMHLIKDNEVYHVNLYEKILVLIFAKISNFFPQGGIWLNTQRPEWNDANNALVGYGLSMVTVCYLRRFLVYFNDLIIDNSIQEIKISIDVLDWFNGLYTTLKKYRNILDKKSSFSSTQRMHFVKDVGLSFSNYRDKIYTHGFCKKTVINKTEIINFLEISILYLDNTIISNINKNGLYSAYNIINFSEDYESAEVSNLYEMLEGQVAVISSGLLSSKEVIELLKNLYDSEMFRSDQNSFMLYPYKKVDSFMNKNIIPDSAVEQNSLMMSLLDQSNNLIFSIDAKGKYRFNSSFRNISDLKMALDSIDPQITNYNLKNKNKILEIFEDVFNHHSFTGRSSNMFAYEGIGSIYWHMVSKLLLAVQEAFNRAVLLNESADLIEALGKYYYKIRSGLSADKTPEEYGAFPFDPYSHTPYGSGAKQPGMTGQVKEEIITRMGEFGCSINNKCIVFNPKLLRRSEFLDEVTDLSYINISKKNKSILINKNELAFTYCQVPVIYHFDKDSYVAIVFNNGEKEICKGNTIPESLSSSIINRELLIKEVRFAFPESILIF